MNPIVLIVGAAALLLLSMNASQTSKPAAVRPLSRTDLPKLNELYILKAGLGRELDACISDITHQSLLSGTETISIVAGLVTGAATLDFNAALKVAKGTNQTLESLGLGRVKECPKQLAKLRSDVQRIEELSRELGLDPNLSRQAHLDIVKGLGGQDYHMDKATGKNIPWAVRRKEAYDKCLSVGNSKASCDKSQAERDKVDRKKYTQCVALYQEYACRDLLDEGVIHHNEKAPPGWEPPTRRT